MSLDGVAFSRMDWLWWGLHFQQFPTELLEWGHFEWVASNRPFYRYGGHFDFYDSHYGMPRGQIHINLPPGHPIMSFETIEIKMAAVSVKKVCWIHACICLIAEGSEIARELLWESYSASKKTILERNQGFFGHSFIRNRFGQCWHVASVSFCLNNLEIWDKICWLTSLLALKFVVKRSQSITKLGINLEEMTQ